MNNDLYQTVQTILRETDDLRSLLLKTLVGNKLQAKNARKATMRLQRLYRDFRTISIAEMREFKKKAGKPKPKPKHDNA